MVQQLQGVLLHPDGEVRQTGARRNGFPVRGATTAGDQKRRAVSRAKPPLQQEQRV